MGIGLDMLNQHNQFASPFEKAGEICFNCGRKPNKQISLLECIFSLNPLTYKDFFVNPSICSHCLQEIAAILNYDIFSPNDELLDGYRFIKKGGLFEVTKTKKENELIFIMGIKPNLPEDYHILRIDTKFEKAVHNIMICLQKGSLPNQISHFQDLFKLKRVVNQ